MEDKGIFVDDDWKKRAEEEKKKLAEKIEGKKQETPRLPSVDFYTLVSTFATQAMLALGVMQNPEDKDTNVNLDLARFNIDMLGLIEEKTRGNLTPEEKAFLEQTLYQLRMAFVKIKTSTEKK